MSAISRNSSVPSLSIEQTYENDKKHSGKHLDIRILASYLWINDTIPTTDSTANPIIIPSPPLKSPPPDLRLRTQKHCTRHHDRGTHHPKNHLRLHSRLHNRLPPRILRHRLHVIRIPTDQRRQGQHPEHDPQRETDAPLERGGLVLEVKVDEDGDGNDGEVDGEAEVGEEGAFVGAVVAGVGGGVGEEEWGEEEGAGKEQGERVRGVRGISIGGRRGRLVGL